MLKNTPDSKHIDLKGRSRIPRERVLMIASLLLMTLGSASCVRNVPSLSQSQVQTGPGGYVLIVRPLGVIKLCVGEKKTFNIKLAYRSASTAPDIDISSDYFEPNWVLITRDNPGGIVTVSDVAGNPSMVGTTGVAVDVIGSKSGTTTVTFFTSSHDTVPKDVTVKVMDCTWEIETWSKWTKSNGFKPRMVSHLGPTQFSADRDGNFDITADVSNQATPGFQVCSVTMSVTESKANVKGRRSDDNVLTFGLKFSPYSISASTTVVCPGASGGNTGSARIINVNQVVFNGLSVPSGGGAIIKPTTVETDTTERGTILIIIIPIDENGNYYLNP